MFDLFIYGQFAMKISKVQSILFIFKL